jgi:uncharacterized protein YPO0396
MLSLSRIFLHNWHRFKHHLIEVEDSLYLAGHNGSGKSSVLDALQVVLLADMNRVRFNSSAQDRSQRNLDSYVRGKIGEGRWLRPGNTVAYIALEWANQANGERFVCGAVIESGEKGAERSFFILGGELDERQLVPDGRPLTRRELRTLLRGQRGSRFIDQVGEYQEELLNRLGGLSERFFDLFIRALTFQPIRDIREFVEQWLLDPKPLDVGTLHGVVERLKELQIRADEVRDKLVALEGIIKHQAEIRRTRDLQQQYLVLSALLAEAAAARRLEALRQTMASHEERLRATENDLELLQVLIKSTAADRLKAEVQLSQSDVARHRNDLERELARASAEAERISAEWRRVHGTLVAAAGDLRPLVADLASPAVDALLATAALSAPPPGLAEQIGAALPAIDEALDSGGRSLFELEAQIKALRERGATIERELADLRRGIRAYPHAVERFRDILQESTGQRPPLLCELFTIPEERWQNAIEAQLGQRRFNVIVPPQQFSEALRLLENARAQKQLYEVGLLDLAKAESEGRDARPHSLALKIETSAPRLRTYINTVLGDIITCEHVDELRQHRRAITPDVVVYQEWTARAIDPKHFKPWFIGERAGRSQIEAREHELATISGQLADLAPRQSQISAQVSQLKRIRGALQGLSGRLDQPLDDRELRAHIGELERELASLDLSGVEALQREVDRLSRIEAQQRGDESRLRDSRATVRAYQERTQSDLREAERALHMHQHEAAEQSLRYPGAASAASALLQEQLAGSVDINLLIRNAENKAREFETRAGNALNRLTEEATTYNTRYGAAGVASNPDEERYAAEHARLSATDLPQYSEQIGKAKSEAEEELREHVLHRLREQIGNAKLQLERINDALKSLDFRGERYRFHHEPAGDLREFYDLIIDAQALGSGPLFQSEFYDKHKATFDRFYDMLTRLPGSNAEQREQDALTDYRRYLTYDIDVTHADGQRSRLSKIIGQTSGGETQTPFYLTIAASFMQLYRINERSGRPTIRLVAFDEAFSKMDQERIGSTLDLFQQFQLQIITATPLERCEYLVPKMCTNLVLTGIRDTVLIEPYRNYEARLEKG